MRGIGIAVTLLGLSLIAPAQTPSDDLFQAVRNNHLTDLKTLLEKGADVNARDRRGATLLMYAAAFGNSDSVKLILNSGAEVNARNSFDATALIWAAADSAKARMLIDKGADVNAATKQGRTPLMIAAACDGCSEIVRQLLAKGADFKAKDSRGTTPLQIAAAAGDVDSMRLLLAAGADAKAPASDGTTPLMSAVYTCSLPGIQLLLSKGADPNAANTFGGQVKFGPIALVRQTPFLISTAFCHTDVVKLLLDAGGDVKVRDVREMTPLMLAVSSETQDASVVRLLVKAGADVNASSKAGETPLDWARKYGNRDVIAILTAAGAKGSSTTGPVPPKPPVAQPAPQAVQLATALLERSSTEFFRQSGCIGCHHQLVTTTAVAAARSAGVPVDEAAARDLVQMIESEMTGQQERLLQRLDPGGLGDGEGYALLSLAAVHYQPNPLTDTLAAHLAAMQQRAGNWHVGDASRAPLQEGDIARTARALRGLQLYMPPARKPEFDERVARARAWLLSSKPATTDDAAMQLAGLAWAGAAPAKLKELGRVLIAAQRPDGGWAPNRNLTSDAFATGESLWALRESGILAATDAAYQKGVQFLLSTQSQDGSWYVRSRAPKFQPYFESGFPHQHDQWISSAATAWAVMALAPAIEKEKRAGH